jgi:3-methyladenine DNA glycosylase/8-oxoguanine DNA glycosylase
LQQYLLYDFVLVSQTKRPPMSKPNDDPVKVTPVGPETQATTTRAMGAAASDETEQLVFTLRTSTGEVLRVEKVDPAGKRSEVPLDEAVGLAGTEDIEEIDAALDDAFEAGITSMFDSEVDLAECDEPAEDLKLRRELLELIVGKKVRLRLQRRLASRLIVSRNVEWRR